MRNLSRKAGAQTHKKSDCKVTNDCVSADGQQLFTGTHLTHGQWEVFWFSQEYSIDFHERIIPENTWNTYSF